MKKPELNRGCAPADVVIVGTDSPALAGTLVELRPRTVLLFLGLTGKTGVLRVREREREAEVRLCSGKVVGPDAVDRVVELLRIPSGDFHFEEAQPGRGQHADGMPMAVVLEQAATMLVDWEETAQAVPSTALVIELQPVADEGTLSGDAWAVSVAVAGGHTTPAAVAEHLRWGTLRTCRAVKELADSGRARLLPPVRPTGPRLSGPAEVVMSAGRTTPPLWPGGGEAGPGWRTPWYDPGE